MCLSDAWQYYIGLFVVGNFSFNIVINIVWGVHQWWYPKMDDGLKWGILLSSVVFL